MLFLEYCYDFTAGTIVCHYLSFQQAAQQRQAQYPAKQHEPHLEKRSLTFL